LDKHEQCLNGCKISGNWSQFIRTGDDTDNKVQNRLNIFSDDADGQAQANPEIVSSLISMLDENNSFGA
jgi:hypothetical protein